jgi:magnesium-transporting ATPase (P-type)
MGQAGSDVAKDASDIVLTDDNFASILNAIEEGRRMFDNIQKFILHLLAENIAQACTLLIGLAFKDTRGLSVFPLAPVEILWVIMITSGMPDMGLGFEIAVPGILQRPPQSVSSLPTKFLDERCFFCRAEDLTHGLAETRCLHHRNHGRYGRLWSLGSSTLFGLLHPRPVRIW